MKVAFVCQAVDQSDPILASTIGWIRAMGERVQCLSVLTLRRGEHDLNPAIPIYQIGGRWKPATALRLYLRSWRLLLQGRLDCFFIYQGGPYPLLLAPFRLLGVRIFQWKAHPGRNWVTFLSARLCDDLVFTSVPSAFPYQVPGLRVVGQGVDTRHFRPLDRPKRGDLVSVTRISPVKNIESMLEALAIGSSDHGSCWTLDVYGATLHRPYRRRLEELEEKLGLGDRVRFLAAQPHRRLPEILSEYRLFLNCSRTALDRAVLEAMACGLPVVSSNPCVAEILPPPLRKLLMAEDDPGSLARRIHERIETGDDQLRKLGTELRALARGHHDLNLLMERIVAWMEKGSKNAVEPTGA